MRIRSFYMIGTEVWFSVTGHDPRGLIDMLVHLCRPSQSSLTEPAFESKNHRAALWKENSLDKYGELQTTTNYDLVYLYP
jgi:hypothetical protein